MKNKIVILLLLVLCSCRKNDDNSLNDNSGNGYSHKTLRSYKIDGQIAEDYVYNSQGKLIREHHYVGSALQNIYVYQYNAGGKVELGYDLHADSSLNGVSYLYYDPAGRIISDNFENITIDSLFYDSSNRINLVKAFFYPNSLSYFKEINYMNDSTREENYFFADSVFGWTITTVYDDKINPIFYLDNIVPVSLWKHNKLRESSPQADSFGLIHASHGFQTFNIALLQYVSYEYNGDYPVKEYKSAANQPDTTTIEFTYEQ